MDLRGLDLRGAKLRGVMLAGAQLDYCDLREAEMKEVVWSVGFLAPTGEKKPLELWREWRGDQNGRQPAQRATLK